MTQWLEWIAMALVVLGTVPAVGYPLAWGLRGTWRGNPVGRALMFHAASLAVLFVVSVANMLVPGAWFLHVYVPALATVVAALYYQFAVLLIEQRRQAQREDTHAD